MTEYNALIDSSVWLDYFLVGSKESKGYIEEKDLILFTSAVSLHEVKKKFLRLQKDEKLINDALDFIKNKSLIVEVNEKISEKSASDAITLGLTTVDSIIYRTAQEKNATLITMDADFRGKKNVKII